MSIFHDRIRAFVHQVVNALLQDVSVLLPVTTPNFENLYETTKAVCLELDSETVAVANLHLSSFNVGELFKLYSKFQNYSVNFMREDSLTVNMVAPSELMILPVVKQVAHVLRVYTELKLNPVFVPILASVQVDLDAVVKLLNKMGITENQDSIIEELSQLQSFDDIQQLWAILQQYGLIPKEYYKCSTQLLEAEKDVSSSSLEPVGLSVLSSLSLVDAVSQDTFKETDGVVTYVPINSLATECKGFGETNKVGKVYNLFKAYTMVRMLWSLHAVAALEQSVLRLPQIAAEIAGGAGEDSDDEDLFKDVEQYLPTNNDRNQEYKEQFDEFLKTGNLDDFLNDSPPPTDQDLDENLKKLLAESPSLQQALEEVNSETKRVEGELSEPGSSDTEEAVSFSDKSDLENFFDVEPLSDTSSITPPEMVHGERLWDQVNTDSLQLEKQLGWMLHPQRKLYDVLCPEDLVEYWKQVYAWYTTHVNNVNKDAAVNFLNQKAEKHMELYDDKSAPELQNDKAILEKFVEKVNQFSPEPESKYLAVQESMVLDLFHAIQKRVKRIDLIHNVLVDHGFQKKLLLLDTYSDYLVTKLLTLPGMTPAFAAKVLLRVSNKYKKRVFPYQMFLLKSTYENGIGSTVLWAQVLHKYESLLETNSLLADAAAYGAMNSYFTFYKVCSTFLKESNINATIDLFAVNLVLRTLEACADGNLKQVIITNGNIFFDHLSDFLVQTINQFSTQDSYSTSEVQDVFKAQGTAAMEYVFKPKDEFDSFEEFHHYLASCSTLYNFDVVNKWFEGRSYLPVIANQNVYIDNPSISNNIMILMKQYYKEHYPKQKESVHKELQLFEKVHLLGEVSTKNTLHIMGCNSILFQKLEDEPKTFTVLLQWHNFLLT
jgi:hypothetical protein